MSRIKEMLCIRRSQFENFMDANLLEVGASHKKERIVQLSEFGSQIPMCACARNFSSTLSDFFNSQILEKENNNSNK